MTAEIYAEWLRRQGQRVLRTESSYWHSSGAGAYQAFPYQWLIDPTSAEISELLARHRVTVLRYSTRPESQKGYASYAIVFDEGSYDLERMGHRTRKNVRRGLRNCVVEPISFQRLVAEGWELRRDTLERQGRDLGATAGSWGARYIASADFPGFQAWGAYAEKRLAAYLVTFQMEDCISIIDQQSSRKFLDLNVNNAITFVVTQHALRLPGIRSVHYGVESLDAPPRVAEFKFHMGYSARPIRQRVVFHPWIAPFVNRLTYSAMSALSKLRPSDRSFSKARGMLRMYLGDERIGLREDRSAVVRSAAE